MSFNLVTRYGDGIPEPTLPEMQAALEELREPDPEHPDCYLTHEESGWTLAAFGSGLLVWENYNEQQGNGRHLRTTHAQVLKHWQALAAGRVAEIEALPWQPGYGQ
jgi:hypothetical protein